MTLIEDALRAPSFMRVRRRVFRQLLESLVYEGAVERRTSPDGASVVDGTDHAGSAVHYEFTARRRYGFARISIGRVWRVANGQRDEADSLTRFLAEAREAITADPDCLARFARELEATLLNDALAQQVRVERGDVLAGADYDTLEGTVTDGHRYHPAYKSRVGFDPSDNIAFGPEFRTPIRPLWIAAHRSIAEVTGSAGIDESAFLGEQLGSALAAFTGRIHAAGARPEEYALVPVHPWQWRERLSWAFAEQLRRAELIVLGEDPHEFFAQQSIRTLSCRDDPQRPDLKLALSIVNTSTSRVLAPHTVYNAPLITDWLRGMVAGDRFLAGELRPILLGEVLGAALNPAPVTEQAHPDTYGTLACIWRESLHRFLDPGEAAVPFTGLTACELDGTPLIDKWVREFGAAEWVRQLVDVAVVPLLHLLFEHGVALEAHAQNMVLVHAGGVPKRVALKDFHDGVRFSRQRLADPERCPRLAGTPAYHVNANSFLETDDTDLVTSFLLDALFFVNVAELGMFLEDHYDLAEHDFWAIVRERVQRYQRRFPELAERFALFDVFTPAIAVEKLTTRRLLPDTELRLHTVPNPLSARPSGSERPLPGRPSGSERPLSEPVCRYEYDLDALSDHVERIVTTLPARCRMFYAMKANSAAPVLGTLAPLVAGFEVASAGELAKARALGSDLPVLFGGPAKTERAIEAALREQVTRFHVESSHELHRIAEVAARAGRVADVLLRVNLAGPFPESTLSMAGRPTQFGVDEAELADAVALARSLPRIRLRGFHLHSVSNVLDPDAHLEMLELYGRKVAGWEAEFGLRCDVLNLGGGIGVNYADVGAQFDWPRFARGLEQVVGRFPAHWAEIDFECGRFLVAGCGTYAAEVLDVKRNHGVHYVVVRGGTHHFRLPASWQHSHPFSVRPVEAWHSSAPRPEARDVPVTVVGELCTPKDVLARDVVVPQVRVGDVVVFSRAGAYGWEISHHDFLSHPHPEHVFVGG